MITTFLLSQISKRFQKLTFSALYFFMALIKIIGEFALNPKTEKMAKKFAFTGIIPPFDFLFNNGS